MAEGVGIEPTHGFDPVYGLAIRCITILPALRRCVFFLTKDKPAVNTKKHQATKISQSLVALQ